MFETAPTAMLLGLIALLYMLPTIIAYSRDHPRRQQLALMNILFGWTLIGWIIVFNWALLVEPEPGET